MDLIKILSVTYCMGHWFEVLWNYVSCIWLYSNASFKLKPIQAQF
jgi:hypothetical protein